jgi:hypothetical protein
VVYSLCSIDEVIGKVLRATRITDTSYIQDMKEWIPEAMGMLKTKHQFITIREQLVVEFHKLPLPSGTTEIVRLEYDDVPINPDQRSRNYHTTALSSSCSSDLYYRLEGNCINFPIADCEVTLITKRLKVDSRGLPMIPDNENYKEAVYWYVRAKMIESGYVDPVFNWTDCIKNHQLYGARAISEIRYPSTAEMDARVAEMYQWNDPVKSTELTTYTPSTRPETRIYFEELTDSPFVYVHEGLPSSIWIIHHNLGIEPRDTDIEVIGEDGNVYNGVISHINQNTLTINFGSLLLTGTATITI